MNLGGGTGNIDTGGWYARSQVTVAAALRCYLRGSGDRWSSVQWLCPRVLGGRRETYQVIHRQTELSNRSSVRDSGYNNKNSMQLTRLRC